MVGRVEPVGIGQRGVAVVVARVDALRLHHANDAAVGRSGRVELDGRREAREFAVELPALLFRREADRTRVGCDSPAVSVCRADDRDRGERCEITQFEHRSVLFRFAFPGY